MKLNLVEILKNAPKGTKLYCTVCGEVLLDSIENINIYLRKKDYPVDKTYIVDLEGKWDLYKDSECILFPSKDNRDWSTFKVNEPHKEGDYLLKKDTNSVYKIIAINPASSTFQLEQITTDNGHYFHSIYHIERLNEEFEICNKFTLDSLMPFDRVLVKDNDEETSWRCSHFSHVYKDKKSTLFICAGFVSWDMCVPYNDDTKHLVGTMDEAPEFYKITI